MLGHAKKGTQTTYTYNTRSSAVYYGNYKWIYRGRIVDISAGPR